MESQIMTFTSIFCFQPHCDWRLFIGQLDRAVDVNNKNILSHNEQGPTSLRHDFSFLSHML